VPSLAVVIRDFTLEFGDLESADGLLRNCLLLEQITYVAVTPAEAVEQDAMIRRNAARIKLGNCFPRRRCFTIPPPGWAPGSLGNFDAASEAFRTEITVVASVRCSIVLL
jgi:hypothetical protein